MAIQIQVRHDTDTNWSSANPTLLAGEFGFETDTNRLKVGDGVTAWNSLPYGPSVNANNGSGFSNMVVQTSGAAASWSLPAQLLDGGAKFKVTIVGGGGQGGGTAATAGQIGGGGGSGGVVVVYLTSVAGQSTMTYTVGAAGSGAAAGANGTNGGASSIIYNGNTYTAGGGVGGQLMPGTTNTLGTGGTATGGTLNLVGGQGSWGGTQAATAAKYGDGGHTPLGLGFGGRVSNVVTTGVAGTGYGAGGAGGYNGATALAVAGGAGTAGIIIIEY